MAGAQEAVEQILQFVEPLAVLTREEGAFLAEDLERGFALGWPLRDGRFCNYSEV